MRVLYTENLVLKKGSVHFKVFLLAILRLGHFVKLFLHCLVDSFLFHELFLGVKSSGELFTTSAGDKSIAKAGLLALGSPEGGAIAYGRVPLEARSLHFIYFYWLVFFTNF